MKPARVVAVLIGFGLTALALPASAQQYTLTDIGTLPGFSGSYASGISSNGQVAGTLTGNTFDHAFLYSNGVVTDIGAAWGDQRSSATAVNANGQVAGFFWKGNSDHAFLYSNGTPSDLGTLPNGTYSEAWGINNSGQVVGTSSIAQGTAFHAFLYANGSMTDLYPGSYYSQAYGINDNGIVVGASSGPTIYFQAAGPVPPASDNFWTNTSIALGISGNGTVVGKFGPTTPNRAYMYANGVVTDMGTLGGTASEALGVNDSGVAVGDSRWALTSNSTRAFVYTGGKMYDLNTLIPANSGWVLTNATGINDSGQIVGFGINPSGQTDSFMLTPTPEPGAITILVLGVIAVFRQRREA